MIRIVIAPDKFKGSLPATQVTAAIAARLRATLPGAELITIPVADGGDGTVDAAVAAGLERVPVTAAGPAGEPVRASYARRGDVAVTELACVCGLVRLPGGRREPLAASSFGAGRCCGPRSTRARGGSSSVSAAAPARTGAPACSRRSGRGCSMPEVSRRAALREVASLDLTGLHAALRSATVILATDADNPLTGPDGAAEMYAPQKGATQTQVGELAQGLRRWAVVAAATGPTGRWLPAPARRARWLRSGVRAPDLCLTWWASTPRWTARPW
jgi:glycerate 2-kinase